MVQLQLLKKLYSDAVAMQTLIHMHISVGLILNEYVGFNVQLDR